jgi:radical SAM protein with 4Fe4S-binding SPASM domain
VCPAGVRAITRPPRAIDVDLFEQLMAELGPTLLTVSLWGWGEPLLHPRLREILRIVRQYPVATFLSTSSQKLSDDEILDALIEYPPTHLIVAIDGLDDETHSRFRIGATLEPILAGVHRLAERKRTLRRRDPVLHMRYIVMKHNQHEFASVKDFAAAHGFDFLTIRTLSLVDALEDVHDRFVPDAHEFRAYDYSNGERLHQQDFICTQPFWFPSVYADGTVVACEQDYNAQHPIGIFSKETSFAQLWSSPNARRVRRAIRDTPYVLSFCRSCPFSDRVTKPCSILRFILNPALPDRIPVAQ